MNDQAPASGIEHRAVAKLSAGAPIVGIVPSTIDEVFRLAQLIFSSGLAPYQLKSAEAVTVVLLKGLEIGLPPMAALECIGVINGKAALHSDGIPALLWSKGFKIREWFENEDTLDKIVAHCEITRPEGDKYTFKYSAQDAKENGLWDTCEKTHKGEANKAPWFLYKKRMTRMRCRGWLARDCAADVLKGMPIYEEQRDIEDTREEPRDITPKSLPLELPDIPEAETPVETQETPATEADILPDIEERLDDEAGFIRKLIEEFESAEDAEIRQEIWDSNADLIARLSPAGFKEIDEWKPAQEALNLGMAPKEITESEDGE